MGARVVPMRIGEILDVIEAPGIIGTAMLALGTTPVSHIVDPDDDTVCWLLPRGAVSRRPWPWARISRYVKVLTSIEEFGVPGIGLTDGPGTHWVYPGGWEGGYIADEWLVEDLAVCTLVHLGPPAQRCELCPKPLWPEDGVRVVLSRSPLRTLAGNTIRVHRHCARTRGLKPLPDGARP
ncbi:hypothetical protein [Streptomyces sp. bgisy084]|uniref:hypothetical protein n=1 Tax=unclassified Streptomyces TaxID=2593676 RepID=UPI003D747CBB